MKKIMSICAVILVLITAFPFFALADAAVYYPASVSRSEDGGEIRKIYELSPEDDPAGIPRSDFEQGGFRYTLTDLLKQEQPEYAERSHTETVELESASRDMESVLALLPQEQAFVTEDGFSGVLTLKLDTVRVEEAGYKSYSWTARATRVYPGLASQDTSGIPKTIEDKGYTLNLDSVDWKADTTSEVDGYQLGNTYTATAGYSAVVTGRTVAGYTVTADYTGTVSHISVDKVRYVAIFEGVSLNPGQEAAPEPTPEIVPDLAWVTLPAAEPAREQPALSFNWTVVWIILGVLALAGGGIGVALALKRRKESEDEDE